MAAASQQAKADLQKAFEEAQKNQKAIQKLVEKRQKLEAQLTENKVVREELDFLESDSNVYKLTGPVLVKQDLEEAKSTVSKRIEYITAELKRHETGITDLQKEQEAYKQKLTKLQSQFTQGVKA